MWSNGNTHTGLAVCEPINHAETVWQFLSDLNIHLPHVQASPILGICPTELLTAVMFITPPPQMSINRRRHRPHYTTTVGYYKVWKRQTPNICLHTNESHRHTDSQQREAKNIHEAPFISIQEGKLIDGVQVLAVTFIGGDTD